MQTGSSHRKLSSILNLYKSNLQSVQPVSTTAHQTVEAERSVACLLGMKVSFFISKLFQHNFLSEMFRMKYKIKGKIRIRIKYFCSHIRKHLTEDQFWEACLKKLFLFLFFYSGMKVFEITKPIKTKKKIGFPIGLLPSS